MPGKYLKAAARACAVKSRFETKSAAEAFAEFRFAAYLCPVCHQWHLTSRGRPDKTAEEAPPPDSAPFARLGDLDWSALSEPPREIKPPVLPPPSPSPAREQVAIVLADPGRERRVLVNFDGRLLKVRWEVSESAKVGDRVVIDFAEGRGRAVRRG